MKTRSIGPFEVSCIGMGCMNLSHAYGAPPPPDQAERVLMEALERGVTVFDTAALYGFGANETLVGRVLKAHRRRIVLASKGGLAGVTTAEGTKRVIDGRPDAIRRNCDDSLRRLNTEVIDLYYLHRWDKRVPIEESIGAMADLVRAGKVRALGLSEVSAATLRRAHAVHPIVCVQSEYSLWSRDVEIAVLAACGELGAAFVAFSPLARGFLTGTLRDVNGLHPKDIRRGMPRFEPAIFARNTHLLRAFGALAREAGCTMAQLALAWVLARGEHVIALPGTTRVEHLVENLDAAAIPVNPALLARADALVNQGTVVGPRYSASNQLEVDTEEFEAAHDQSRAI
jgi:aryl-alcohol dehydrogenase-like predicted oxidoreductase